MGTLIFSITHQTLVGSISLVRTEQRLTKAIQKGPVLVQEVDAAAKASKAQYMYTSRLMLETSITAISYTPKQWAGENTIGRSYKQ